MMTKSKFNQQSKLKNLVLIPLAIVLFIGVACVNGQNKNEVVAAIAPTKMNVLYLGVDNPVAIAVSGYDPSELTATIDNGQITGTEGYYNVRPGRPGSAIIVISTNGKEIMKAEFRVKMVPDPVAAISLKDGNFVSSGRISSKDLLEAGGITAVMQNFDFDLQFKVVSFVISATLPNSYTVREEISKTEKFSENQIDFIKSLIKNQKLMIEEITVTGPDELERKLNSMVFNINGE